MQEAAKNRRQSQAISDIIESYHNRFNESYVEPIPNPFHTVQEKLKQLKKENKRLLINSKDANSIQSVVVRLDYIGDRWAMGKYRSITKTGEIELPFTFHYSDIISSDTDVVIIPEGKRAFGNGKE